MSSIAKGGAPVWLNEGLAIFLANQKKISSLEKSAKTITFFRNSGKEVYDSGLLVRRLIKVYGKKRLLALLNNLHYGISEKKFNAIFKKIYGFPLSEKELIKHLS